MNRCSFCEWIPILPWPIWPLAGQLLLGQNVVVGSMTLLLAVRGKHCHEKYVGTPVFFTTALHHGLVWSYLMIVCLRKSRSARSRGGPKATACSRSFVCLFCASCSAFSPRAKARRRWSRRLPCPLDSDSATLVCCTLTSWAFLSTRLCAAARDCSSVARARC